MEDNYIFDYRALEGKIKQYYDTQESFANALGIARSSLNLKLNGNADFTSKNIYKMSELLNIKPEEISEYFFTKKV